jgi:hypothetical protein
LHDSLIDSYKCIGKIKKEEKDKKNSPSESLTRLVETVDKFWHHLENEYRDKLPSVGDAKKFNKYIKTELSGYEGEKIAEIANKIRANLLKSSEEYSIDDFKNILEYLKGKIP